MFGVVGKAIGGGVLIFIEEISTFNRLIVIVIIILYCLICYLMTKTNLFYFSLEESLLFNFN